MVNAKDFFSGNYLKAEDCKGGEICEILDEGEIVEIQTPEGKTKAVMNIQVNFNGTEKTFTPNKSNGNIADFYNRVIVYYSELFCEMARLFADDVECGIFYFCVLQNFFYFFI